MAYTALKMSICFSQLLFLSVIVLLKGYSEEFTGLVSHDTITHTSFTIPHTAKKVVLDFWTTHSSVHPYVLLAYDKIPSINDYDEMFALSALPNSITVTDTTPTASIVYIAFWGGEMVHSYRYFAGNRAYAYVGATVTVDSCDYAVPAEISPECTPVDMISFPVYRPMVAKIVPLKVLNVNETMQYALHLPSGMESVNIAISNIAISDTFCNAVIKDFPVALILEVYLDQPLQDKNYFQVAQLMSILSLCDVIEKDLENLLITIPFPIPGIWTITMSLELLLDGLPSSSSAMLSAFFRTQSLGKNHSRPVINHSIESTLNKSRRSRVLRIEKVLKDVQKSEEYSRSPKALKVQDTRAHFQHSKPKKSNLISLKADRHQEMTIGDLTMLVEYNTCDDFTSQCDFDNTPMSVSKFGMYAINLFAGMESAPTESLYKVYEVSLQEPKVVALMAAGMEIHLVVRHIIPFTDQTLDTVIDQLLAKYNYVLAARVGNIPINPMSSSSSLESLESVENVIFGNTTFLCTVDDIVEDLYNPVSTDVAIYPDEGNIVLAVDYSWSVLKPTLNNIAVKEARSFYFLVAPMESVESDLDGVLDPPLMSLQVLLTACPDNACVHGSCKLDQSTEVVASTCDCRYPWAGERCDELALSESSYNMQVSLLVVSNAAMLPAIVYSYQQGLPLLVVGLTISSASSAFYHLCDTDMYCLGGLTFESLHVSRRRCFCCCFCPHCFHRTELMGAPLTFVCVCVCVCHCKGVGCALLYSDDRIRAAFVRSSR